MAERIQTAVRRLELLESLASIEGSLRPLHAEQTGVFTDFIEYALRAGNDEPLPFARIILPPRTGKTVIAGHIIRAMQLTTVFLEPTKALVEQTARELENQLPGTLVATYYGEVKEIAEHGINVMTYAMFLSLWKKGELPEEISRSALIIPDEAHHAMTEEQMRALREAFDPHAIRLALTASPDYNENRQLRHFFPYLIHEILILEAVGLGLLAKAKILIHEVDIDASQVNLIDGDFDDVALGNLMSVGPFFERARSLRYDDPDNRKRGCMVVCRSRQQALDQWKFLNKHKPEDAPQSALILAETPGDERRDSLAAFDAGTIDTIVQVKTLIEGWNAPRCKLLIDLAPTVSKVFATQKFFRPLTKSGDATAEIHVLLPRNLQRSPILPNELLNPSNDEAELVLPCAPKNRAKFKPRPLDHSDASIHEVEVKSEIVLKVSLERPLLDPSDPDQIRTVLASVDDKFDPSVPLGLSEFRLLIFDHLLFRGMGTHLLRFLKVPLNSRDYHAWITALYPALAPESYLREHHQMASDVSCYRDVEIFLELVTRALPQKRFRKGIEEGWRTLFGPDEGDEPTLEELINSHMENVRIRRMLDSLTPMEARILRWRFGLDDEEELTLKEIGDKYNLGAERIRQMEAQALAKMRRMMRD